MGDKTMGIQDDIFDVSGDVRDTDTGEAFDRICKWAFDMEEQIEVLEQREEQLITTIKVLRSL